MTMAAPGSSPTAVEEPQGSTMHVYALLRAAILRGDLAPESAISQVRLARDIQVSRAPVREALRLLQTDGLVTAEHNRRMRVAPLTVSDLEQIYALRLVAEPLGVRLTVPQLTSDELDAIAAAHEEVAAGYRATPGPLPYEPHRRFHTMLTRGSGPRLRGHIEEMWDLSERYRQLLRAGTPAADLAIRGHEAIVDAARERDAELCSELVAVDLARIALLMLESLDPSHDPHAFRETIQRTLGGTPAKLKLI
jgi:DNA-binding GntR family transcriptional regulator